MDFTFSPLLGIVAAGILGGAIGLQRQAAHKAAGFRTHLIVAAASAAFTAMGAHLHDTRIPSYIVVGIGFLGGGAIIRQGVTAHGLTTAASIWMAAAVGLLLGYANSFGLFIGLLATAITLLALNTSDDSLMRLFRIPRKATLKVSCVPAQTSLESIDLLLRKAGIGCEPGSVLSLKATRGHDSMELKYNIDLRGNRDVSEVVRQLSGLPGVECVEASEPYP